MSLNAYPTCPNDKETPVNEQAANLGQARILCCPAVRECVFVFMCMRQCACVSETNGGPTT